jgi:hypothetical protein
LQTVSPASAGSTSAPAAIILLHPFTRSSCQILAFPALFIHPTLSRPNFQIGTLLTDVGSLPITLSGNSGSADIPELSFILTSPGFRDIRCL